MKLMSIVIPCYNEEKSIPLFYKEVTKTVGKDFKGIEIDFEFIFVDDGSSDDSLKEMKELAQKDKRVKYISFSRNFGKEAGILAGLKESKGDFVTLMDVDLQDPPKLLKEMYLGIVEEGYDSVGTRRSTRKGEPVLRSLFSRMFYKLINKMSKVEMIDGARDFRLMTRQMVNSVLELKEYNRYSKGLFSFVGFKTKWLEYENIERVAGKTKFNFWKLFVYAIDGITAFSTAPLAIASFIGMLFCLFAFIMIVVIICKTMILGDPTSGWPSLVCIIFFVSGVQLFSIGIIGQYLARAYLEIKDRPIYIVKEQSK